MVRQPVSLGDVRRLRASLQVSHRAIRAQLDLAAASVEPEAFRLAQDLIRVHRMVKGHLERARDLFGRVGGGAADAGGLDGGPAVSAELRQLEEEHAEMLHHTRPLVEALQLFDSLRQLIEHSSAAVARLEDVLEVLPGGALAEANISVAVQALDRLCREGLREVYNTDEERRVLAEVIPPDTDEGERDRGAVPGDGSERDESDTGWVSWD